MTDDLLIGRQLANYKIERLIGRGGMAQVYYGQDTTLHRPVAIKVIDARNRDNPAYAERFVRESRAVAPWRHENIIQIYYAGDQDGLFYFAMEYVDGVDLGKQLARYATSRQKMPQAEVLRIGSAVATALDYAHAQGVIHRDVKPANVLLARDGRVILSDFGLAMDVQQGSLGEVFGSSQYIAPEQARRSSDAVPQSDLYSLGVILYQALTGVLPFDDPSPTTVALQHVTLDPPSPRKINPELNKGTSSVLLKALSKDPADRYQTGADLIAALERALRGVRQAATATQPSKKLKSTENLIGQQIDEYRLDLLLGQGGMARIYRGLDVRLNRYAAIKVIDAPHRADADYAARFRREAQAIAQLEHHHIVRLYRYGEVSGLLYMAMQYVEGRDLQSVLAAHRKQGEGLPPREISQIVREVCLALDYAHSRGVIHRDVKPSNIMIDESGHAILTDFGLALLTEVGSRGEIFGSPYYIAPEQAISSANATAQSDLYALGIILYEIFTGQVPFDAASPLDIAMLHMTEAPRPPRQLRPAISPQIEAVILKALAKEPRDRYLSGAALADAVDQALRAVPTKAEAKAARSKGGRAAEKPADYPLPPIPAAAAAPAPQAKPPTERAAARPRRRVQPFVYLLGLLLVVAVAVGGVFIFNSGNIFAPDPVVSIIPTATLDLTQPAAEATIATSTIGANVAVSPPTTPTVPPSSAVVTTLTSATTVTPTRIVSPAIAPTLIVSPTVASAPTAISPDTKQGTTRFKLWLPLVLKNKRR